VAEVSAGYEVDNIKNKKSERVAAELKDLRNTLLAVTEFVEAHLEGEYVVAIFDDLEKAELNISRLKSTASEIGESIEVDDDTIEGVEHLAKLFRDVVLDFPEAIRLFLEILKKAAHRSDVYHQLNGIYHYDIDTIIDFDLLDNALTQFANPRPEIDPIFYAYSYTYIGWLLARLGRVAAARQAFNFTDAWRYDHRGVTKVADYGHYELDFLCDAADIDLNAEFAGGPVSDPSAQRLVIGTVLFGNEYCDLLENISGASLFCPDNLEVFNAHWNPLFLIFAPPRQSVRLRESVFIHRLSKQVSVRIVTLPEALLRQYPDPPPEGKPFHPAMPYAVSSLVQVGMAEIARRHGSDLIIMPPDELFSNRVASVIHDACEDKKDVVMASGLRLDRAAMLLKLKDRNVADGISPKEMVSTGLPHLHSVVKASFATEKKVTHPGILYWPSGKDGLVAHAFQHHPLYLSATVLANSYCRRMDSIDGDFVASLLPKEEDWSRIKLITEADEQPMASLESNMDVEAEFDTGKLVEMTGPWVLRTMRPLSFWLFKQRVNLGNTTKFTTGSLRKTADALVEELGKLGEHVVARVSKDPASLRETARIELETLRSQPRRWARSDTPTGFDVLRWTRKPAEEYKVLYTLAVWGRDYVSDFIAMCLPSMLIEGNLLDLPNNAHSKFLVYTRDEDRPQIEASDEFRFLCSLISVEIISIDDLVVDNKYTTLSSTQSDSVQRSREFDSIVFLYSDFVWARGAIAFSLEKLADDYDGIVAPVPPLVREDFADYLEHEGQKHFKRNNDLAVLDFAPRELISLGKSILHPMMRDNIIGMATNSGNPAYVLWTGPADDLLIRCFHAHPVMLRVMHDKPEYWQPFHETLDEVFLPKAFASIDRLYFLEDSDDLTIVSLTERDFPVSFLSDKHRLDARFISRWAEACAAPMHKLLFNRACFWHEHDIDLEQWRPTLDRSQSLTDEVALRLTMPDSVLLSEDPLGFGARADRFHRKHGVPLQITAPKPTGRLSAFAFRLVRIAGGLLPQVMRRRLVGILPSGLRGWVLRNREPGRP
jgi:hypothetical protein